MTMLFLASVLLLLSLLLHSDTHTVAGVRSVVVRIVNGVNALFLVYAVAGTHAGVFDVAAWPYWSLNHNVAT